jgi:hypothetical protein
MGVTLFGLPALTALFVFGGFFVAVIACGLFARFFNPTTDRWLTLDDLFRGRATEKSDTPALRR